MKKKILACVTSFFLCGSVFADVMIESIPYSDHVTVGEETLILNGAGLRKKFVFKVYSAGLYLNRTVKTEVDAMALSGNKRVKLGLLRDVSASSFVGALEEGIEENTPKERAAAIAGDLKALIAVMNKIGDVHEGDIVHFDYSETELTSVSVNGRVIGEKIGGKDLYNAVLGIWLGLKAIDSDLKKSLLAK